MTEPIAVPHLLESTIQQVLVVEVGDQRIGLPASSVQRIAQITTDQVEQIARTGTLILDDQPIQGVVLGEFLGELVAQPRSSAGLDDGLLTPILDVDGTPIAIVVDGLLDVRNDAAIEGLTEPSDRFVGRCRMCDDRTVPVVDLVAIIDFLGRRDRGVEARASKVMIIDDSRAARGALTKLVRTTDADVTAVGTVDEALTTCEVSGSFPDLILLDAELGGFQAGAGTAVLRRTPGLERVPIVVLALRDAEEHRRNLLDLGATEILLKPFSVETLLQLIRRFADPSENIW